MRQVFGGTKIAGWVGGLLGVGLILAGSIFAVGAQAATNPCEEDMKANCSDVQPGGGRLLNCLQQNLNKVSAKCKDHWITNADAIVDVRLKCANDVEQFCSKTLPGQGRLLRCLQLNHEKISPDCLAELPGKKKAVR